MSNRLMARFQLLLSPTSGSPPSLALPLQGEGDLVQKLQVESLGRKPLFKALLWASRQPALLANG